MTNVKYLLLLLLTACLAVGGFFWKRDHTPEAYVNRGYELQAQNRFPAAVGQFRQAIQRRPADPDLHAQLARALMESGYRTEPRWIGTAHGKKKVLSGVAYRPPSGAVMEAISEYRTAIRLKPNDSLYHYDLGGVLLEIGQQAQALPEFRAAVRLSPGTEVNPNLGRWDNYQFLGENHQCIGLILENQGKEADAINEYYDAIHYQPMDLETETELGRLLVKHGQRRQARYLWNDVRTKFATLNQAEYANSSYDTNAKKLLAKYPENL